MNGSIVTTMPVKPLPVGIALLMACAVAAEDSPAPTAPDMDLIEFLGSLDIQGDSGQEVLTAIDTGLLTQDDCSCTEAAPDDAAKHP